MFFYLVFFGGGGIGGVCLWVWGTLEPEGRSYRYVLCTMIACVVVTVGIGASPRQRSSCAGGYRNSSSGSVSGAGSGSMVPSDT